jgi:hypothetical protein
MKVPGATIVTFILCIIIMYKTCSASLEEGQSVETGKLNEATLWPDWRETHKKVLRGASAEVLRAVIDWVYLMNQPKATVIPDQFKMIHTNGGACTDDHKAAMGVFGFSCNECKCARRCTWE